MEFQQLHQSHPHPNNESAGDGGGREVEKEILIKSIQQQLAVSF